MLSSTHTVLQCRWTFSKAYSNPVQLGSVTNSSLDRYPVHRTIGFSNTNVVESHNRRGNQLVGTRLRPAGAVKGLYNIDQIDAESLGKGDFNQIRESRGRRNRSDSILHPVSSGTLSTKKRSKSGGGPIQKKARSIKKKSSAKSKQVGRKDAMMDSQHALPKNSTKMRERELEYNEMSSRFQEGLLTLREKIRHADGTEHVSVERRAARLDTLVEIMTGVHAAGSYEKLDTVKRAILDGLESSRNDIEFREALFKMFISCLGSTLAGNASATVVPRASQVQEAVQESNCGDSSANPSTTVLPRH